MKTDHLTKGLAESEKPRCCMNCAYGKYENMHVVCRRFPPIWTTTTRGMQIYVEEGGTFRFPVMAVDQWCGEYRRA